MQPYFLTIDQIVRIHLSMIEKYGGKDGIRESGLLHSAVAMPMASYNGKFLHENIFEMAAAYLYHIVQNHPFLDGNKRTGAAAAIIFLLMNGVELEPEEDGLVNLTMGVSQGTFGKSQIAESIQKWAR